MKPYYEQDGITIYHGDCRGILTDIEGADLVLTDPPYGIKYELPGGFSGQGNRRVWRGGKPPVVGDDEPFDPIHLLRFERLVLFGANYYAAKLPPSNGWIVWDKTGGGRGPSNNFSDCELAWTNVESSPVVYRHLWKGLVRDTEAGEKVLHPTQKPVSLMAWIIERYTTPSELIVDPYMGSGPVAEAALSSGRRYIGIEIEERYCEIAAKRLAQGAFNFSAQVD